MMMMVCIDGPCVIKSWIIVQRLWMVERDMSTVFMSECVSMLLSETL